VTVRIEAHDRTFVGARGHGIVVASAGALNALNRAVGTSWARSEAFANRSAQVAYIGIKQGRVKDPPWSISPLHEPLVAWC
jgi:hypothetical protein